MFDYHAYCLHGTWERFMNPNQPRLRFSLIFSSFIFFPKSRQLEKKWQLVWKGIDLGGVSAVTSCKVDHVIQAQSKEIKK